MYFLCSSPAILQRFEKRLIEYHHGGERFINKLRDSGFNVSFKEARYCSERHGRKSLQEGYIFATSAQKIETIERGSVKQKSAEEERLLQVRVLHRFPFL